MLLDISDTSCRLKSGKEKLESAMKKSEKFQVPKNQKKSLALKVHFHLLNSFSFSFSFSFVIHFHLFIFISFSFVEVSQFVSCFRFRGLAEGRLKIMKIDRIANIWKGPIHPSSIVCVR